MKIAVEGCAHGELDAIYAAITAKERAAGVKVDLLLCCGDFQAVRNAADLASMAVPPKFRYYSGDRVAPVLTIFIGGNHEGSSFLCELPYGGWVAPNIYYLGWAGVVQYRGIRIGGISGIYKRYDYQTGHHESPPFDPGTLRSVYHQRVIDTYRLKQIADPLDVIMSHDWPVSVVDHGDTDRLLQRKPFFRDDVTKHCLGSPVLDEVMRWNRPKRWFSGHLHCRYQASIPHKGGVEATEFLALDKCLPRRQFLEIIHVDASGAGSDDSLQYDPEWLTILRLTNSLLSLTRKQHGLSTLTALSESKMHTPDDHQVAATVQLLSGNLTIPETFAQTAPVYNPAVDISIRDVLQPESVARNEQTSYLCRTLDITNPVSEFLKRSNGGAKVLSIPCRKLPDDLNATVAPDTPDSNKRCSNYAADRSPYRLTNYFRSTGPSLEELLNTPKTAPGRPASGHGSSSPSSGAKPLSEKYTVRSSTPTAEGAPNVPLVTTDSPVCAPRPGIRSSLALRLPVPKYAGCPPDSLPDQAEVAGLASSGVGSGALPIDGCGQTASDRPTNVAFDGRGGDTSDLARATAGCASEGVSPVVVGEYDSPRRFSGLSVGLGDKSLLGDGDNSLVADASLTDSAIKRFKRRNYDIYKQDEEDEG